MFTVYLPLLEDKLKFYSQMYPKCLEQCLRQLAANKLLHRINKWLLLAPFP